jgi:Fe-S-cluster containining protein
MKKTTKDKIKKWLKVKCMGCGGCCTNSIVPVSMGDVKRLMKHTGKPADEIIRLVDPNEIAFETDHDGWIHMSYGKRIMALRKQKDRCQFLNDEKQCTVYEGRPMTCRTFPLQIHLDEEGEIENVSLNRMIKQRYPSGSAKPWKIAREQAYQEDTEDETYHRKVEKWNNSSKQGGKLGFMKFMGLVK